jgi:hypothetical protein
MEHALEDLELDRIARGPHCAPSLRDRATHLGVDHFCGKLKFVVDIASLWPQYLVSDCIRAHRIAPMVQGLSN